MDKFVEKMNEVREDVMEKMKEVKEIIMSRWSATEDEDEEGPRSPNRALILRESPVRGQTRQVLTS